MKHFTRALFALAIATTLALPAAACTGIGGTFVGRYGIVSATASSTAKTFSGTFHSKLWGNGTFANVTTDGATYASGTITLSVSGKETFKIVPISATAIEVTIGGTTFEARCGESP